MTAPQMVGSIINAQWLADHMGLSVTEVTARIEQARKEDQWHATHSYPFRYPHGTESNT